MFSENLFNPHGTENSKSDEFREMKLCKLNTGKWNYRFGRLYEDLRPAHLELILRHVDGPQDVLNAAPRVPVPPRPRLLGE